MGSVACSDRSCAGLALAAICGADPAAKV